MLTGATSPRLPQLRAHCSEGTCAGGTAGPRWEQPFSASSSVSPRCCPDASYHPGMLDPELLERITARGAELDELEEQLDKQLAEVRAERDELAVAERVLERVSEQLADERVSAAPAPGQVGGRAVMLVPHREPGVEETMLPPDYQRILAAVRQAAGPVMARQVGDALGVDVSVRAKLEPLRSKLVRLVDRGWLRKLPDGRFTTRL